MSNSVFLQSARALGLVAAGALALGTLRPAAATPSGLIIVPSTDIYAKGTIHLDVDDNYALSGNVAGTSSSNSFSTGLTYGVGPDTDKPFGRTEVGFDVGLFPYRGQRRSDTLTANIKTQLYNNPTQNVRVVAGGYALGNSNTARIGYLTVSKNFGDAGRIHLGVSRFFHDLPDPVTGVGKKYTQVQVAYEKLLTDKVLFLAEYNSGTGPLGTAGVSAVYQIDDRSGLQLAYVRPNSQAVRNASKGVIYLGYDRNFGKRAGVPAPPPDPAADGEAKK